MIWQKRFSIFFTLIFIFCAIQNLGCFLFAGSNTLPEALMAIKIDYVGECFMMLIIMMCVFNLCKFDIPTWLKTTFYILSSGVYISVLGIGKFSGFYKNVSFEKVDGVASLTREYGIMAYVFFGLLVIYFINSLGLIIYANIKRKDISKKIINLLLIAEAVGLIGFLCSALLDIAYDVTPLVNIITQVVFIRLAYRVCFYDVSDSSIDSMVKNGSTGFLSIDYEMKYLGANDMAKSIFQEIGEWGIDKALPFEGEAGQKLREWIASFKEDETKRTFTYKIGDKSYSVKINHMYVGKLKRGYQFYFIDNTAIQNYIDLIDNYNAKLQEDVNEAAKNLLFMQNKLVMTLATMIESRDNSTGGHINRTAEVVRLIVEEMHKDEELGLSVKYCADVVLAAPMHDLGKIAVDDAILRKPGKYTPEEYAKMKIHSQEGARIINEALDGIKYTEFKDIATNIAHYHHERLDGAGYPKGLKGKEIPLEARIMAIADVYDALVSKRVYKERMSFEDTNRIILAGMGTQFDKDLEKYYLAALPKIEEYYSSLEQ